MAIRMSIKAALTALLVIGSTQPLTAQRAARGPNFHKNSVKYSDAGAKPVTGRSGSASLDARALMDADGSVLIEATTGDLEYGTKPGQIRKMQMKILSSGKHASTQNFAGRGDGYWSTKVAQLGVGSQVQLQANIGGIDARRNDVVTVTVPVMLRPDVAVDGVAAPSRALAGVPMNVVATVSERNGDVGARASCILSIDGQLTDQARAIWIDAGDTVSCAFQAQMASVGSHKVTVSVTGVSPMDWNGNDNSASATVDVLSPETPLGYSASFTASDLNSSSKVKQSTADGSFVDENTNTNSTNTRLLSMTSTTTDAFTFPVRVRSAIIADGISVLDYSNDIQMSSSSPAADCGELIDGRFFLRVCNLRNGTPHSEVALSSLDGRVTYFGSHLRQMEGEDAYIENTSSDTPMGVGAYAATSSVQSIVELTDARGMLFSARPTMSLQTVPVNEASNFCFFSPYNQMNYCTDTRSTGSTRTGSANGAR